MVSIHKNLQLSSKFSIALISLNLLITREFRGDTSAETESCHSGMQHSKFFLQVGWVEY